MSKEGAEYGAYINQHLSLVRLDKNQVNPLCISHFLESPFGKLQFSAKNQTGVKPGLNFDAIKFLEVLSTTIATAKQVYFLRSTSRQIENCSSEIIG